MSSPSASFVEKREDLFAALVHHFAWMKTVEGLTTETRRHSFEVIPLKAVSPCLCG
jgi:hypothetical protein